MRPASWEAQVARTLRGGELLILEGDLGMGKTAFARGLAIGLGIPGDEVSSPLVHAGAGVLGWKADRVSRRSLSPQRRG